MFLAKLKATVATLMVVAVLGGGLVYSGSGGSPAKPQNELEALRRDNELLKVNLRVTLEKIESLEKQVKDLKLDTSKRLYAEQLTATQRLAEALDAAKDQARAAAMRVAEAQARRAEAGDRSTGAAKTCSGAEPFGPR